MTVWLKCFDDRPDAVARLVCFAHAGGSAQAYAAWTDLLPPQIELLAVQLPGRENRIGEAPFTRMQALAEAVATALGPYSALPFAFFGHSMGARLSFAVATELKKRGAPLPVHLVVSGSRPPHVPPSGRDMHTLNDSDFLDGLRRMGGTPESVLRSADLMQLMLPAIRADFEVLETWAPFSNAPGPQDRLPLGISAFGGADDTHAPPRVLAAWQDLTDGPFSVTILPGGHFYLRDETQPLVTAASIALFRHIAQASKPSAAQRQSAGGRAVG